MAKKPDVIMPVILRDECGNEVHRTSVNCEGRMARPAILIFREDYYGNSHYIGDRMYVYTRLTAARIVE